MSKLADRLEKVARQMHELALCSDVIERTRLLGKAEGLRLAASYVEECEKTAWRRGYDDAMETVGSEWP